MHINICSIIVAMHSKFGVDMKQVDSSDVGSEDEDRDTKACQVLRRLQSGQYDVYFANEVYRCPFYTRRLGGTDFNCLVMHAEGVSSCTPKIGEIMNLDAFYAKHKALTIHLRNLQQVAIAEGRMRPIRRMRHR